MVGGNQTVSFDIFDNYFMQALILLNIITDDPVPKTISDKYKYMYNSTLNNVPGDT